MFGCLIAAITYYPIFWGLTHFGNPDLEIAMANSPVTVIANSRECAFQFVPSELKAHIKFTSSCDMIKNLLNQRSVTYTNEDSNGGSRVIVKIGNETIYGPDVSNLTVTRQIV
jgi:hypothetical protein